MRRHIHRLIPMAERGSQQRSRSQTSHQHRSQSDVDADSGQADDGARECKGNERCDIELSSDDDEDDHPGQSSASSRLRPTRLDDLEMWSRDKTIKSEVLDALLAENCLTRFPSTGADAMILYYKPTPAYVRACPTAAPFVVCRHCRKVCHWNLCMRHRLVR